MGATHVRYNHACLVLLGGLTDCCLLFLSLKRMKKEQLFWKFPIFEPQEFSVQLFCSKHSRDLSHMSLINDSFSKLLI